MTSGKKNKAAGTAREVKGKLKRVVGKAVGSPGLQAEGAIEEATGKAQKTVGKIQDELDD